jgi:hypothetical protein
MEWKFERSTNSEICLSIRHFFSCQHILKSLNVTYSTLHKLFQFIILYCNQQKTQSELCVICSTLQKRKEKIVKI